MNEQLLTWQSINRYNVLLHVFFDMIREITFREENDLNFEYQRTKDVRYLRAKFIQSS